MPHRVTGWWAKGKDLYITREFRSSMKVPYTELQLSPTIRAHFVCLGRAEEPLEIRVASENI